MLLHVFLKHRRDRLCDDAVEHLPLGHLVAAHQVELQLAEARRIKMAKVTDPRHGRPLAEPHGPLPGAGHYRLVVGDREAGAHARLLVDEFAFSRGDRDLLEDLLHEGGHGNGPLAPQIDAGLLLSHADAEVAVARVVRVDHGADAVLELRNHLP